MRATSTNPELHVRRERQHARSQQLLAKRDAVLAQAGEWVAAHDEVLRAAGVEPPDRVRGPLRQRVVLLHGTDGRVVVSSYAELDSSHSDRRVFVVDRIEGQLLLAIDVPSRPIVRRDASGRRWVRHVARISVVEVR